MRLHRTPSLHDRKWRNEENENWSEIEDKIRGVDRLEDFLKGFDGRQMIQQSYNLFNKDTVTEGVLNQNTGAVEEGNYYVSDFIPVTPGTRLHVKPVAGVTVIYDQNLNFLLRIPAGGFPYLLPSNARYIRTQMSQPSVDGKYVYLGEQDLPYAEYGWDYMPEFYDMIRNIVGDSEGEYINIFNKETVVEGTLNQKTGAVEEGSYYVSDFIPVEPGRSLQVKPIAGVTVIYDADSEFVLRIPSGEFPYLLPPEARFVRTQMSQPSVDGKYVYMGTKDMPYYPYGEGPSTSGGDSKPLKVLSIGNSYSNDTFWMLKDIAQSTGKELTVGVAHLSGGSLSQMWDAINNDEAISTYNKWTPANGHQQTASPKVKAIVEDEPWDIITFQQASTTAMDYSTYQPYLNNIVNYVKNNATNPNVRYGVNMPWVRPISNSSIGDKATQLQVNSQIVDACQQALFDEGLEIFIPTGMAIMNGRSNSYLAAVSDELTRDGSHLDEGVGRFLAAMTAFITLYGDHGIGSVSYNPSGVNDYHLYLSKIAAQKAVIEPFKVTEV